MLKNQLLLAFYFFSLISVGYCVLNLPDYIPTCYQAYSDEEAKELSECFALHANKSKGFMRDKGIPEVAIPPLNDVSLPRIEISQTTRSFNYTIVFKDIHILGLDDYVVHDVKYNWRNLTMSGLIYVKNIELHGRYEISGRIFEQNFTRSGPLDVKLVGVDMWYQFSYTLYMKDKIKRAKMQDFRINIVHMDDMVGELGDLFGESSILNKAANEFVSSKQILASVKPEVETVVLQVAGHIAKTLLNIINYDTLLLPRM